MGNGHNNTPNPQVIIRRIFEEDIHLETPRPSYILLNNGKKCPIIGLGTALIKTEEDINVVYQSIADGVRLIDIEPSNEIIVGKAIKMAIDRNKVKREDLFIVTKLELEEKDDPEKALNKSLERLKLEYVDLYLDHWPSCKIYKEPKNDTLIPVKDTWKKMESLVEKNLTKSIGVCNYTIVNILNIISVCKIKPAVVEVEFHPYLYQKDLKEFCDLENIVIFAYNSLVKGEYCKKEPSYPKSYDLFSESPIMFLYRNEKYKHLTRGQIALNWYLSLGIVPITGTSKKDRMKENLGAGTFTMSKRNIDLIGSFEDRQHRFNNGYDIFGVDIFA